MGDDQSVVCEGFFKGNTLEDILETYLGDLVGDTVYDRYRNQFPLLIKLLDINERLSVQVHPDDTVALQRYDSYGKKECWYVLEAGEDAVIWLGFKKDVSATEFYEACRKGTADELLNAFHPKKGECYLINPGTVHAAGGGLVIAEVQQASDVTLRLYDWGRENNPATARQMHLEEALDCIDYGPYDEKTCHRSHDGGSTPIADCDRFTVRALTISSPIKVDMDDFKSCVVYICTDGTAEVSASEGASACSLKRGEALLLPANLDEAVITPSNGRATLIEAHIREISEKDNYIREGVPAEPEEETTTGNGRYKS